jgi:transcriptional regulator with XRE-family HTH domain
MNQIGYTLRIHRLALGLTQQQVAVSTGYSLSYLKQIEQGKTRGSYRAIDDMLRLYGTSVSEQLVVSDEQREQAIHSLQRDFA